MPDGIKNNKKHLQILNGLNKSLIKMSYMSYELKDSNKLCLSQLCNITRISAKIYLNLLKFDSAVIIDIYL